MKLYFITVVRNIYSEEEAIAKGCDILDGARTIGFFETLTEARKCVKENWGDLFEGNYYKYAIIEDMQPGLYRCGDGTTHFYKKVKNTIRRVNKPAKAKIFRGFTQVG